MIDAKALLNDLKKRVTLLENDLRERCAKNPEIDAPLKAEYESARAKGRTGLTYNAWRDEEITQVAVAWILAGVFVRFLEDNDLIEVPFLAGPTPERQRRALDEHSLFFRQYPTASEREYFEHVFAEVGRLPGMKHFFDRKHNPLWRVGPTADAAKSLLEFWRKTDPDTGRIHHDFTDPDWNTRFLGDLYQDLSEFARKRYALLQTPVFVEQFILDRTLTPAIQTFGFKVVRMIDPTCGSGHFLLGGFARLFRLWQENDPGEEPVVLAQRALSQVYGVDLNPNVVAIARFRLLIAALRGCGVTKLRHAPDFRLNLAAGDSLLHGSRFRQFEAKDAIQQTFRGEDLFRDELQHFYETEDREELHRILGQQYHAVVGNPPYIIVRDKALNEAYRIRFTSCYGKYSLAAPFMERFFDLAADGSDERVAGFAGMITSNSFMKREFGKKLIEEIIPKWDITHVIDTAGAFIPGHGTPTVILFGKNQRPTSSTVRCVMGIKGEPFTPEDPSLGLVWSSITNQLDMPGSQGEFVSVADTERSSFCRHPWSIGGGGASELKEDLNSSASTRLADTISSIGFLAITGEDDAFVFSAETMKRHCLPFRPFCTGDAVRDWRIDSDDFVILPYDSRTTDWLPLRSGGAPRLFRFLWPLRTRLKHRNMFGKTMAEHGFGWCEYIQFIRDRMRATKLLVFAEVASHNHFVLDRGGRVFKQTAPVITLENGATEDDHFALLALLNSSASCFSMKQTAHQKQMTGGDGVRVETKAKVPYQFSGTQLQQIPVPQQFTTGPLRSRLADLGRKADALVADESALDSSALLHALIEEKGDSKKVLEAFSLKRSTARSRQILIQEQIDFTVYAMFDLVDRSLLGTECDDLEVFLQPGMRPYEIAAKENIDGFEVFAEIPKEWPEQLRLLWKARINAIESSPRIKVLEDSHYKRRWIGRQGLFNHVRQSDDLKNCARNQLLERLEGYFFEGERVCTLSDGFSAAAHGFAAAQHPAIVSTNQLAAIVEADAGFLRLAEIYSGNPGFSVAKLVRELVESESVPFLPFQRYKENGLRKRQDWEHVWDLQWREDAIDAAEDVDAPNITDAERELRKRKANDRKKQEIGDIPVPPKYASADFRGSVYWKLRGKLDVPKERWIIYPGGERDGDPSPMIAWAGWDHLQQAQALAAYYIDASQNQGWPAEKLRPLLAGLADLLPWLKQWHNEFNPDYASGLGDYFAGFLDEEARKQGTTIETLNKMRFGITP